MANVSQDGVGEQADVAPGQSVRRAASRFQRGIKMKEHFSPSIYNPSHYTAAFSPASSLVDAVERLVQNEPHPAFRLLIHVHSCSNPR
jgi:hypothetical protein